MVNHFRAAIKVVLENEGGYVNDPNDSGGETKFGISKRSYPHLDIKEISEAQAEKIYFTDFWLKYQCEKIFDEAVAIKFFDLCVNMGGRQATLCLQRACNACHKLVDEDGIMGPKTLSAINEISSKLILPFKSEAAGYYRLITALHPKNEKYLNGWINRAYA